MTKKRVLKLNVSKKNKEIFYSAALFCYPELKALEYQCNRQQLKVFKDLVVSFWISRSVIEKVIK